MSYPHSGSSANPPQGDRGRDDWNQSANPEDAWKNQSPQGGWETKPEHQQGGWGGQANPGGYQNGPGYQPGPSYQSGSGYQGGYQPNQGYQGGPGYPGAPGYQGGPGHQGAAAYQGGPGQRPKKNNLPIIIGAAALALLLLGVAAFFVINAVRPRVVTPDPTPVPVPTAHTPTVPRSTTTSASPSKSPDVGAQLNQKSNFTTRDGSGTWTVYSYKWTTDGIVEPDNGAYLVIDTEILCNQGSCRYSAFNFKGKTPDGREYREGFGDRGNTPKLSSGTLKQGEKARGYVVFDAPKGDIDVVMTDLFNDVATTKIPGN